MNQVGAQISIAEDVFYLGQGLAGALAPSSPSE
jgi:hypothetical protein